MKDRKTFTVAAGVVALAVVLLGFGYAHQNGYFGSRSARGMHGHMGMMMGGHAQEVCDTLGEFSGAMTEDREQLLDETVELRRDISKSKLELEQLWLEKSPSREQLVAKLREANSLKARLDEAMLEYRLDNNLNGGPVVLGCDEMHPGRGFGHMTADRSCLEL